MSFDIKKVLLSRGFKFIYFLAIASIFYKLITHKDRPGISSSWTPGVKIHYDSKIEVSKDKWLYDAKQIGWKQNCLNRWDEKESGVTENIKDLELYITECSRDAEAGIYYNNFKARQSNNPIIKIAVSVPFSRKNGVFDSIEILKGVELAQRKINKARGISINGQKALLEIGIVNEGWNAPQSDEIEGWGNKTDKEKEKTMSQLVANAAIDSDIVGIIGHFSSDAIEAAASTYNNKLVAISPTSTAVRQSKSNQFNNFLSQWLETDKSDVNNNYLHLNNYIFRTAPNDSIAVNRLKTEYIATKNVDNIIIVYDETSRYSLLYRKELKKQLDNNIISKNSCGFRFDDKSSLDPMEVKNCVNNITKYNPDALILVLSTANISELKSSFKKDGEEVDFFQLAEREAGYLPQLIGSDTLYNEQYIDEGNVVSVAMEKREQIFPKATEDEEYETIEVNWVMSTAYDAVIAMVEGLTKSTKCLEPTSKSKCRRQIQKSLASPEFAANGILGNDSIKFNDGDRQIINGDDSLAVVLIVKDGSFINLKSYQYQ